MEEYWDEDPCFDPEAYDRIQKAKAKNESLVRALSYARDTFCGLGTRKVKLQLNKLAKESKEAEYVRRLLEVEDINIQAKANKWHKYKQKLYNKKEQLLKELVSFCKENGYVYGSQETDDYSTSTILYFELPDETQISFHCNGVEAKPYTKEWDKKRNSTLPKLQRYIVEHFKIGENNMKNFKCPECGSSYVAETKTNMREVTIYDGWDLERADICRCETEATDTTEVTYTCYDCGEDLTKYFKEETKND